MNLSKRYYKPATGMLVIIKPDKSFTLVGNDPDSVLDVELSDLAEDIVPQGWTRTV